MNKFYQCKQLEYYSHRHYSIAQIASAMEYLGKRNVIHGSLALHNIFLIGEVSATKVVITDYGFAPLLSMWNKKYDAKDPEKFPIRYLAPEALFEGKRTKQSDVWSFGNF